MAVYISPLASTPSSTSSVVLVRTSRGPVKAAGLRSLISHVGISLDLPFFRETTCFIKSKHSLFNQLLGCDSKTQDRNRSNLNL